jgi:integrase
VTTNCGVAPFLAGGRAQELPNWNGTQRVSCSAARFICEPTSPRNKQAWKIRLVGDLLDLFRRVWSKRIAECPFVFHDGGRPIGDFKKAWKSARQKVGLDGLLVHDMRRSCARNVVRSGTPERIAMTITGHATRSMFDRHNISSDADLEAAMERVSDYVNQRSVDKPKIVPINQQKVA